jgi:hypothetical protein
MSLLWLMTCNDHLTCTGIDQPTQHLQGGGFPGAIGTKKSHHLPRCNGEGNVPNRGHIAMTTVHKMLEGASQASLLIGNPIDLAQLFNRDQ